MDRCFAFEDTTTPDEERESADVDDREDQEGRRVLDALDDRVNDELLLPLEALKRSQRSALG